MSLRFRVLVNTELLTLSANRYSEFRTVRNVSAGSFRIHPCINHFISRRHKVSFVSDVTLLFFVCMLNELKEMMGNILQICYSAVNFTFMALPEDENYSSFRPGHCLNYHNLELIVAAYLRLQVQQR